MGQISSNSVKQKVVKNQINHKEDEHADTEPEVQATDQNDNWYRVDNYKWKELAHVP